MSHLRPAQRHSSHTGNNAHDREQRMMCGSSGRLWIPGLISSPPNNFLKEWKVWPYPVFEEVQQSILCSCVWLNTHLLTSYQTVPVVIVDNHNYVLPHRWHLMKDLGMSLDSNLGTNISSQSPVSLIHIDQHADMNEPARYLDEQDLVSMDTLFDYTRDQTTIASFIRPALQAWWISNVVQVRSSSALYDLGSCWVDDGLYILDIDLDFRDPRARYSTQEMDRMIPLTQKLMSQAHLITIATSPLFIDQEYALGLLRRLFGH